MVVDVFISDMHYDGDFVINPNVVSQASDKIRCLYTASTYLLDTVAAPGHEPSMLTGQ